MKRIFIIAEGISDFPSKTHDGKTPLELARTPNLDLIAKNGMSGLCKPIPSSLFPGSDVGFLSLLGNNPVKTRAGKGFFEARGLGLGYKKNETYFRVNLIPVEDGKMMSYGSSSITNDECTILANALNVKFEGVPVEFYPVAGYRLIMVANNDWLYDGKKDNLKTYPPIEKNPYLIKDYYPRGNGSEKLIKIMEDASLVLSSHDINKIKIDFGENPANGIWLWGQSSLQKFITFEEKFACKAFCIPGSHIIRGIALSLGIECSPVIEPHSTLPSSLLRRTELAFKAIDIYDTVILHIETINDISQKGGLHKKCQSIESFDEKIVGKLYNKIQEYEQYRIMVASSHITGFKDMLPVRLPVPWVICGTGIKSDASSNYSEKSVSSSRLGIIPGYNILEKTLFQS